MCETRWIKARQAKALEAEKKRSTDARVMIAEQARRMTENYLKERTI